MLIPVMRHGLFEIMTDFFWMQYMHIGAETMNKPINTLPMLTTNLLEKTTSRLYYPLRQVSDNLSYMNLMLKVCLSGPDFDCKGFPQWLGRAGCAIVEDPLEADFVIFTGGMDVNPELYGENCLKDTYFDLERDDADTALYALCRDQGIPMVGICRGAQFLWVMKGGKLFQDVDNHNEGEHEIFVFSETKKYRASSVHHQMVRPENIAGMKLLANTCISRKRESASIVSSGPTNDFEIYAFPDDCILGFQGHPEYQGFPNYSELCIRIINQYIYQSDKTIYKNGLLRVESVIKAKDMH